MSDIIELQKRFPLRGVTIESGQNGLTRIAITTAEAEMHVYLHGAHVTHFLPREERDLLFLSAKSNFARGKPIRGGVPIIFPWFGPKAGDASSPAHGFARTSPWNVADILPRTNGSIAVVLELSSSDATRKLFPYDFHLTYTVTVGASLDLSLEVRNDSKTAFNFEEALHTYLAVGDVRRVQVIGLGDRTFLDKMDSAKRKVQPKGPIVIQAETDRVYVNSADSITVADPALNRRISVEKEGSQSTVLWNPWVAKSKSMSDFGDEEWPRMLCVETANAAENAVTLPAGQRHQMRARLSSGQGDAATDRSATKQWEMADFKR